MWLNLRLHSRHMCGGGQVWLLSLQYNRSINSHCSGFVMFCYGYVSSNLKLKSSGISHYNGVIMGTMAPQITSLTIFYSTVYSGAAQRKYHSRHWLWQVNSPQKCPVMRKMFPFDDVIMLWMYNMVIDWLQFQSKIMKPVNIRFIYFIRSSDWISQSLPWNRCTYPTQSNRQWLNTRRHLHYTETTDRVLNVLIPFTGLFIRFSPILVRQLFAFLTAWQTIPLPQDVFVPGPSFRISDSTWCHRIPLCHI